MSVPHPLLFPVMSILACGTEPGPVAVSPPAPTVQQAATPAEIPAATGQRRFVDEGYHFDYPAELRLQDHSGSRGLIRADVTLDEQAGFQVRVMERGGSDTFDDWVTAYQTRFMDEMQGHHGGEIREVGRSCDGVAAGQPCKLRMWLTRGDGQEWLLLEYIWPMASRVLVFQGGCPFQDSQHHERVFDAVAATVIVE